MDTATAQKILQNYGMPITPQNMNAVMRESGNQSALLGRSMGMQGGASEEGYDDSLLKSRLSKMAGDAPAKTDTTSAVENPSANTPAAIANVSKTYPDKSNVSSQSGRGTAPATEPAPGSTNINAILSGTNTANASGYYPDEAGMPTAGPGGPAPEDTGLKVPDWLIALLGLGAARNTGAPAAPPMSPNPQLTGPTAKPALTYQPKLGGPGDVPTMPSGAPDNTANMPQSQQRIAGPQTMAPEGAIPSRKEPVRPTFTPQEELTQALMNFRKMFRK